MRDTLRRGSLTFVLLALTASARADVGGLGDYVDSVPIRTAAYYGLEPALRFQYSSASGNGFLGAGWSLAGLSEIRRVSDARGIAGSTNGDLYLLDGMELLACGPAAATTRLAQSPSCRYRPPPPLVAYTTRIESHRRIAYDPTVPGGEWLVWSTSGTLSRYASALTGVTWEIVSVEDTAGHRVRYSYKRFAPGLPALSYPDTISYNATVVRFVWQVRPDVVSSAQGDVLLALGHRLAAVRIETEAGTARVYGIKYAQHPRTGRSIVTELAEYGSNAAVTANGSVSGTSKPAVMFTYGKGSAEAGWSGARSNAGPLQLRQAVSLDNYRYGALVLSRERMLATSFHSGDVDGDGRTDAIQATISGDTATLATLRLDTRLASNAWVSTSLPFTRGGQWYLDDPPFDSRLELLRVFAGDVNGDERDDLIVVGWEAADPASPTGGLRLLLNAAVSTGDGRFAWLLPAFQTTSWTTPVAWGRLAQFQSRHLTANCGSGDFNGDGRADFACALQDGNGGHRLGVAFARGSAGFQITSPTVIANDPVVFETREIAIADMNRDGLSDITFLDPRPSDLVACAELPEANRTCTIRFDLLTGISDGVSFGFSRAETPWERGSTQQSAPGALAAADIDGNGLPDILYLPGELFAERDQSIREINVARREEDGSFTFPPAQVLPTVLSSVRVEYGFGDVDGDLRTDLVVVVPIEPGGGSNCSGVAHKRALIHRARSLGDGTFALPSDWRDCALGQEVTDQWARWSELTVPGRMQLADTNGDALADVMMATVWARSSQEALLAVSDRVSEASGRAALGWAAVDLNGDGRTDLAWVAPQGSQNWVHYRIAQGADRFGPAGSQGTATGQTSLPSFSHNGRRTWRWLDLNGDGRLDLAHLQCEILTAGQTCLLRVDAFLSDGVGGFAASSPTFTAARQSATGAALTWQPADVDGDGRADLLAIEAGSGPTTSLTVRVLLSQGNGQFTDIERQVDVTGSVPAAAFVGNLLGWRAADVNGDGRVDLVHLSPQATSVRVTTLIALGGGEWRLSPDLQPDPAALPIGLTSGRNSPARWYPADVNGDGATDFVRQLVSATTVYFHTLTSTGRGRWISTAVAPPMPATLLPGTDFGAIGWFVADSNGDGRSDLIRLDRNGHAVRATVALARGLGGWTIEQHPVQGSTAIEDLIERPGWMLADTDGDSRMEMLAVQITSANGGPFNVEVLRAQPRPADDRLTVVELLGARTRIDYSSTADFARIDTAPECGLPASVVGAVVRSVSLQASRRTKAETLAYRYVCPRWSRTLRTFLGWNEVVAERPVLANQPGSRASDRYALGEACLSQRIGSERRDLLGRFVGSRHIVLYRPPGAEPPFDCQVSSTRELRHASDPLRLDAQNITTEFVYDEFGNIVVRRELGGALDGDERFTSRNYRPATGPYIVDRMAGEQIHDGPDSAAPILSAVLFCYDGDTTIACSNQPTRGQLTMKVELYEQSTRVTQFAYDAFGNVASTIDANRHGMEVKYDPVQHIYPIAFVNALGRTVTALEWNRRQGLNTVRVDENGNRTEIIYDAIEQPREIQLPTGARITRTYSNLKSNATRTVEDNTSDGSPGGLWVRQVSDSLGRVLRVERKGSRPNETLVRRFEYLGASSRLYRQSDWFARGSTVTRYQTLRYDAAGQLARIDRQDGAKATWRFDSDGTLGRTVATDEMGRPHDTWTDAYGRIVRTREWVGGQPAVVQLAHDGLGRVKTVTDPNGNVTQYTWNRLGQMLSIVDPGLGRRLFTYDKVGNMLTATDARNRTTSYTYDELDRPRSKVPPFGPTITWNYDEPGTGAYQGRLTSIADGSAAGCAGGISQRRQYDTFGRLSSSVQCIAGQMFDTALTYDPLNRVRTLEYPDGEIVTYGYNLAGWLSGVSGLIDAYAYDSTGRPTSVTYSNGVSAAIGYHPFRGQIESERYRRGQTAIYDATYTYERDGTLKSSTSSTNAMNLLYTHDELGRLTSVTGDHTQSWSYDVGGNMTFNSSLGFYTYPVPGPAGCPVGTTPAPCLAPQGVRSAGKYRLDYDANGLVSQIEDTTTQASRALDWTADHRPFVVRDWSANDTTHTYDGLGRRVMEQSPTETVRHVGALVDVSSVTGTTKYYFAGSRLIGASRNGVRWWFHTDRAGSVRAVTDANGAVIARHDYQPYGTPSSGQPPSTNVFRGQRPGHDDTGLFVGVRYYDPEIGRFLAPDTIVPDLLNSQAFNRYAFNYNSPALYTDPSGHQPHWIGTSFAGGPAGSFGPGGNFLHQPWASSSTPAGLSAGLPGSGPTALNLSPIGNWTGAPGSAGPDDGDVQDDEGSDLLDEAWDNAPEMAFGGVTGALEGVLPVGWLLPFDKVGESLDFSADQQAWFDVGRGLALTGVGITEIASGLSAMAAGAPPTVIGGITVETGVGALVLAGGASIEVAGAIVAVEGATDVVAGLGLLYKSGLYILVDRKGNIRYIGKAKSFPTRKSSHKESKPPHKFYELDVDIKDKDVRTFLETWGMQHCKTCDWNKINGMSPENRKFMYRQMKALQWLEERGITLPASLEELILKQVLLR